MSLLYRVLYTGCTRFEKRWRMDIVQGTSENRDVLELTGSDGAIKAPA